MAAFALGQGCILAAISFWPGVAGLLLAATAAVVSMQAVQHSAASTVQQLLAPHRRTHQSAACQGDHMNRLMLLPLTPSRLGAVKLPCGAASLVLNTMHLYMSTDFDRPTSPTYIAHVQAACGPAAALGSGSRACCRAAGGLH